MKSLFLETNIESEGAIWILPDGSGLIVQVNCDGKDELYYTEDMDEAREKLGLGPKED